MNTTPNIFRRFRFLCAAQSMRAVIAVTLLGAATFSAGCFAVVAAGAAGGAVAWVRGAVVTNSDRELDRVYAAAQQAIADLKFARISERKSAVDAELVARTALDKKIDITLEKLGSTTKISIRVGLVGDQGLSLSVLDRIKAHL